MLIIEFAWSFSLSITFLEGHYYPHRDFGSVLHHISSCHFPAHDGILINLPRFPHRFATAGPSSHLQHTVPNLVDPVTGGIDRASGSDETMSSVIRLPCSSWGEIDQTPE
jgi:hypothetical protein